MAAKIYKIASLRISVRGHNKEAGAMGTGLKGGRRQWEALGLNARHSGTEIPRK